MPTFKASVCRISYGFRTIEVKADSEEQAKEKILEEAGNYEFSEHDARYSLDSGVQRVLNEQYLKFKYNDKDFDFKFTPEEEDWWTAFKQHNFEFDVHYLEDEDNQICVYLYVGSQTLTREAIHIQKIKR